MRTDPFARFPQAQDWVRWGFVALPMIGAMPHANALAWILIGITLVLSVLLLWLKPESGPTWVGEVVLPAVAIIAGTLWVLVPNSWSSVTVFTVTFIAVLRLPRIPVTVVMVADAVTISLFSWRIHDWPGAFALYSILLAILLLGLNRRSRLARIEQTELALARAQTATEEHARAAALAEFHEHPDRKLRFPVNSIQCNNAVWKIAVDRLLDRSDAVVMDLADLSRSQVPART